jgi:membrane protein required for colicin V production
VSWIDWAFLVLVTLSVVVGLVRGLLYEVMSLLGWIAAYVAAQAFGPEASAWLPFGTPGSALNAVAGFVVVFVLALLAWSLLSWAIRKLVQASPLNPLDRALGAVFGLLRGVLVALVIATAVNLTPLAGSAGWQASRSAAGLDRVLDGLRPLLPPEVARHLQA